MYRLISEELKPIVTPRVTDLGIGPIAALRRVTYIAIGDVTPFGLR
jgi:hypothetical protein